MGDIKWLLRKKNNGDCSKPMMVEVIDISDGIAAVEYPNSTKTYFYDARNIFSKKEEALSAYYHDFEPFDIEWPECTHSETDHNDNTIIVTDGGKPWRGPNAFRWEDVD